MHSALQVSRPTHSATQELRNQTSSTCPEEIQDAIVVSSDHGRSHSKRENTILVHRIFTEKNSRRNLEISLARSLEGEKCGKVYLDLSLSIYKTALSQRLTDVIHLRDWSAAVSASQRTSRKKYFAGNDSWILRTQEGFSGLTDFLNSFGNHDVFRAETMVVQFTLPASFTQILQFSSWIRERHLILGSEKKEKDDSY